ncbi:MAG: hypothetical protein ACP5JJ_16900 [Anaerolineae bacterium]
MKQAIVIIGGYNSWWSTYLRPGRDLEDLTGLPAIGVPLLPWNGDVCGDGVVPVANARLEGAGQVILDGVAHGRSIGANWYAGSSAVVRRWWPSGDARGT